MALTDAIDGEEQIENTGGEPSGTHLYFYEEGHERMDGWPENVQSIVSEAFEAARGGSGVVRLTINKSGSYYNLNHVLAEFIVGLRDLFEDRDFGPLMEMVGPDAEAIDQYLSDNPEIEEELRELRTAAPASADD